MENKNMTEQKKFSVAFVLWLFGGMFGAHKVYIEEKVSVLLWYWLASMLTFGLVPLISLFKMKNKILLRNNGIK